MMSFPLLLPAAAWAAGTWTAGFTRWGPGPALGLAAACLAAGWLSYFLSTAKATTAYLLAACFFLGAASLALHERGFASNPLQSLPAGDYHDFSGTLFRSPSRGIDRDYLFLRVDRLEAAGPPLGRAGNLRVAVPHTSVFPARGRLLSGDALRLTARITPPIEFRNFGPAVGPPYLRSQGLHNLAFAKSALFVEALPGRRGFSMRRAASALRQSFQDGIERHFRAADGGLTRAGAVLEAMLLGERRRMDEDVTLSFQESGLFHLIAISGAHVAIISLLSLAAFRRIGLPPRPAAALLIALLLFYAMLVEGSPSVLRATIMAAILAGARLFWREANTLNTAASSFIFLLLLNPFSLFEAGFELTYAATLSIILFERRIASRLPRLPWGVDRMLALSAAALAGIGPIIAGEFHRVTPAPLVLNLAAMPVVAAIMAAGFVFLPLACVSRFLGAIAAFVLKGLIGLFLGISGLAGLSPVLSFRVAVPAWPVVFGYYAFLLALLLPRRSRWQRPAVVAGFIVFASLLVIPPRTAPLPGLRVTFLDVGQGDSILVEFPGRTKMLVDGGGSPTGTFDTGERVVSPRLWREGVTRLAIIVSTHPHPDHIKGLMAVARNFGPAELWQGPDPPWAGGEEKLSRDLERAMPGGSARLALTRGYSRTISDVRVDILHPGRSFAAPPDDANDRSLVLRIRYGRTSFLLVGDSGFAAEAELARSGYDLRSGVLKAGHHGSDSSSGRDFLGRVAPRLAVITVGAGNPYGLPRPAALARIGGAGASIYRTDRDGAVEITSDGRVYSVRTASDPDKTRIFR